MNKSYSVISFAANKGGVGKTRNAILIANCLGAAGKRVLLIDTDYNNSATTYYLPKDELINGGLNIEEIIEEKNLFEAMANEKNGSLLENIFHTKHRGVDVIPATRSLANIRAISENRLSCLMPELEGHYDFVIIDCQPEYNNIVINSLKVSDAIITPVIQDLDSFNAAVFFEKKLQTDMDKLGAWFLTINGYNKNFDDAKSGTQREYIKSYLSRFSNFTPKEAWFPWTPVINKIKDREMPLSYKPVEGMNVAVHPALYNAVCSLAELLLADGDEFIKPEVF
ncbi:MAG: AAA family ATPase [Treponema sp.]|jgi:chromosome partitioning protein|nr:AAA family ATPase [Treponema sp.]